MEKTQRKPDAGCETAQGRQSPDPHSQRAGTAGSPESLPAEDRRLVRLALITGARIGELLALKWEDTSETELVFWETKNGKGGALRCLPPLERSSKRCRPFTHGCSQTPGPR